MLELNREFSERGWREGKWKGKNVDRNALRLPFLLIASLFITPCARHRAGHRARRGNWLHFCWLPNKLPGLFYCLLTEVPLLGTLQYGFEILRIPRFWCSSSKVNYLSYMCIILLWELAAHLEQEMQGP